MLGNYQDQQNRAHNHGVNDPTHAHGVADPGHAHSTDVQGHHAHGYLGWANTGAGAFSGGVSVWNPTGAITDGAGAHGHNITASGTGIGIFGNGTGISIQVSGDEARPRNIAYPVFIKY